MSDGFYCGKVEDVRFFLRKVGGVGIINVFIG